MMVRIERSNKVVEYKYSSSLSRNNINNRLNAKTPYGIVAYTLKCEQWIDFHSTIFCMCQARRCDPGEYAKLTTVLFP